MYTVTTAKRKIIVGMGPVGIIIEVDRRTRAIIDSITCSIVDRLIKQPAELASAPQGVGTDYYPRRY